jgi:hypothetical protein
MADEERGSRRLGGLVNMASGQLASLVRQEIGLVKREVISSARQASEGAALLGGAGAAGAASVVFASVAAYRGLGRVMGRGPAATLLATAYGVGAAVLARRGLERLSGVEGTPRSVETLKRIPPTITRGTDA